MSEMQFEDDTLQDNTSAQDDGIIKSLNNSTVSFSPDDQQQNTNSQIEQPITTNETITTTGQSQSTTQLIQERTGSFQFDISKYQRQRTSSNQDLSQLKSASKVNQQVKLKLSNWDKALIVSYNLIEPLLIACLIGTSLQIAQLGSSLYITITCCILLPLMLTSVVKRIQIKKWSTLVMVICAPIFTFMKMWIWFQFTDTKNVNSNQYVQAALGVWPGQRTKTYLNDVLVFLFSGLLYWHYTNQIQQAEYRLIRQGTLKFQTQIKLLHSVFGDYTRMFFAIAYALYFFDTLVYITFVNLVILLILLQFMFQYSTGKTIKREVIESTLTIIQITSYVTVALSFIIRLPRVLNGFENNFQRLLQTFGLEGLVVNFRQEYLTLSIMHRIILSLAIVMTLTYKVSRQINITKPVYIVQSTDNTQNTQELALPLLQQPSKRQSISLSNDQQLLIAKPENTNKDKPKAKKLSLKQIWNMTKLPLLLWLCRLICFFQTYRYLCWQSLVPLVWTLHSFLFQDRQRFVQITMQVYLPLFYICYLWFFIINIFGLVNYSSFASNSRMLIYGFYYFNNPTIELPICLLPLVSIGFYVRFNRINEPLKRSIMQTIQKYHPSLYSVLYLTIVNIQIVVFVYLVIFSLLVLNLYHMIVLVVMVIAMFQPFLYNRNIVWLLVLAESLVLSMYIYSLSVKSNSRHIFAIFIGYDTGYENQKVTREYFRYAPPVFVWFFVLAVAIQYRRNLLIGIDEIVIKNESKKADERIQVKMPRSYSVFKGIAILIDHLIVILTFTIYLTTIFLIRRTFMNGGSLLLILWLLGVYLTGGIGKLLKYWRVFQIYQSLVLLSLLFVQFFIYTSGEGMSYPYLVSRWDSLSDYSKALLNYIGFYKFQDPLFSKFLPQTFMFFFSIIVEPQLKQKFDRENQNMEEHHSEDLLIEDRIDTEDFDEVNEDEIKFLHVQKRYNNIKSRIQYLLWKLQPIWPVFTYLSFSFKYLFIIFILACAVYYSIAVIWLLYLAIFMLQTWKIQREHMKYTKEQIRRFAQADSPFEEGRETISSNQKRLIRLQEISVNAKANSSLIKELKVAELNLQGEPRIRITDEEAVKEYQKYTNEIYEVTNKVRASFWSAEYTILVVANFMIYISVFLVTPTNATNPETLVPSSMPVLKDKVVFVFYYLGFYNQPNVTNFQESTDYGVYWPFYVLLLLITIEKLCEDWLKDRIGTSDELIQIFIKIEKQYAEAQQLMNDKGTDQQLKLSKRDSVVQVEIQDFDIIQDDFEFPSFQKQSTFNPLSIQQKQNEKELHDKMYPLLTIKQKLKFDLAMKILLQEVAIMLVFISLIYEQSILSFILFIIMLYYTIQKFRAHGNPMLLVRYFVVLLILVQYILALLSLSSYNSPKQVPNILTFDGVNNTVYPNSQQYYFYTPLYFYLTSSTNSVTQQPEINVSTFQFYGFAVTSRQLNGLWVEIIIVVLTYIYLNNYSIWIIKKQFKIVLSETTQGLLMQYKELKRLDADMNLQLVAKQIQQERTFVRLSNFWTELFFTNFPLLMIIFLLLTSVFSHNFVALGYFIFSMVLIYNYRNFFKRTEAKERQKRILKYYLLPYLLLDIFAQLVIQIPFKEKDKLSQWSRIIGYEQVWQYNPATIYLGEMTNVVVTVSPKTNLSILFLKAVIYFVISVQLQLVEWSSFLKFYDKILFENLQYSELLGLGLAYRFNNFKNKQLKKQSENYATLDYMLKHVKKLLKRKDFISKADKVAKVESQDILEQPFVLIDPNENALNYRKQFRKDIELEYKKRMQQMNLLFKIYLWLRRNLVQDILFKHSLEHLKDIVMQYKEGRTSIRCQIELGTMIEVKQDWLNNRNTLLLELKQAGKITEDEFEEFQRFRRKTISEIVLKPWERYDQSNYKSWTKFVQYFLVMLYKIFSSNLHILCYLFMILATMMNGGMLYMVYPALIFGIALCEEERPGKRFWYFVIFYTQLIILIQYIAQLTVWQVRANSLAFGLHFITWSNNHNFGVVFIQDVTDYSQLFWLIFPELAILVTVLIQIQCETIAGIFDVSLYQYEPFIDSLKRATNNMMLKDEKFVRAFKQQGIESQQMLRFVLEFDQNLVKKTNLSEEDLSEERAYSNENLNITLNSSLALSLRDEPVSLESEILKYKLKVDLSQGRKRAHSFDFVRLDHKEEKKGLLKTVWDNSFFDRLFPIIKQQKPGLNLYVGIAATQIIIIIYIILAFTQMSGQKTSISQQFSDNQFSGAMVLSMLIMIVIMVIDRYFYSSQSFLSRKYVSERLDTNSPILGSSSQDKSQDSLSINEGEANSEEHDDSITFQDWLIPQYIPKSPSRTFRFFFLWFVLVLIHYYIFFWLTNDQKVCGDQPYCNKFTENTYLLWFYIIFCIYFALSANQIKFGLPELKRGGFMLGSYDPVSKITYETWYYTPFLFELRTIIDWTFTTTALDVFQSISLAQIQSDMFVAKCYNRPYMQKQLGQKIPWFLKLLIGFSLMLFILFLIAGPMLLFSTINPVGQANPVSSGEMTFYFKISNLNEGTNLNVPLFTTTQLTKNQTLTETQFEAMDFNNPLSQSYAFLATQTQALQFSPISDDVWSITQPKKNFLVSSLNEILTNPDSPLTVTGILESRFNRDTATSVTAVYENLFVLTSDNQTVITNLTDSINCNTDTRQTTFPNTINTAISLNQKSGVYGLSQQETVYAGFTLTFVCSILNEAEDYWELQQNFAPTVLNVTESQIFQQTNGFGYFTFNQQVLPNFLSEYASSVIFFYVAIVYVIATTFRSAFVPQTWQIFIIDAPYTEEILMICQCIYIYRVQKNLKNEEELYHILLEIMRSPETIKSLCGSSLKKKLE